MKIIFIHSLLARRASKALPLMFLGALLVYALWPWCSLTRREGRPRTIVFLGFSILDEVMNKRVFPAFQQQWQAGGGESIEFVTSFACSGTVTNQLILGVPAEIALLSLEL